MANTLKYRFRSLLLCTAILVSCCASASAHEGPPFPILMDEPIPDFSVSVWADPDIGVGTFYIVLEPQESLSPATPEPKIEIWIQPRNQRLPKATYQATRQDLQKRIQFLAEPVFDQQEEFDVGIVIHSVSGQTSELTAVVEATPPGLGPWDLVIYLFPFVLFGGLWIAGFSKRLKHRRIASTSVRNRRQTVDTTKPKTSVASTQQNIHS